MSTFIAPNMAELYTNDVLRKEIEQYFKAQNKRITNLAKATKPRMIQIIQEHGIPLPPLPEKAPRFQRIEPYELKDGILTFSNFREQVSLKVGDTFDLKKVRFNFHSQMYYGTICKFTPKQVQYKDENDKLVRVSTEKFISGYKYVKEIDLND